MYSSLVRNEVQNILFTAKDYTRLLLKRQKKAFNPQGIKYLTQLDKQIDLLSAFMLTYVAPRHIRKKHKKV